MMVWAVRILAIVVLVLGIALGVQSCRLSDRDAEMAVRTAEKMGWTRDSGRPNISELPKGSKPVAVVSGGVTYLPRRPAPESSRPVAPQASTGGGCDLDSLKATIDCRAEIASASGVPVARLWVSGKLSDAKSERILPWARVGDPITILLPDGGEQPVVTEPPVVKVTLPRRLPWALDLRAGLTSEPGVRVGATWYLSGRRLGIAADYERSEHDQRIGLLASFRLGPS